MKGHLKSQAAPNSWTFLRKVNRFTTRPSPGAHPLQRSLPVNLLLKKLGFAKTTKEAKKIVNDRAVLVDGKPVKDYRRSVGFMDIIHVKPSTNLRCSVDKKGKLVFVECKDPKKKVCRVTGKKVVSKGKTQLSLLGGRSVLLDKSEHKVGDSVVLDVPSQKISDHLKLAKGQTVFLLGGRHMGNMASVVSVDGDKVLCKGDKVEFETLKKFTFVVGKDKPVVQL